MEERMRILKMLEEGKLNVEEAAKLLEALREPEKQHIIKVGTTVAKSVTDLIREISEAVSGVVKEKTKETKKKPI